MEKNAKLKKILSLTLVGLLLIYIVAIIIFVFAQRGNGIKSAIWFEEGMASILLQGLTFNTNRIGVEVALAIGFSAYFSIVAFVLGLLMVISKKCGRYLSNPFVALIGLMSAVYFMGGFIHSVREPSAATANFLTFEIVCFSISAVLGAAGFVFSMVFPLQVHQSEAVKPTDEVNSRSNEPAVELEAEQEKESPAKEASEEIKEIPAASKNKKTKKKEENPTKPEQKEDVLVQEKAKDEPHLEDNEPEINGGGEAVAAIETKAEIVEESSKVSGKYEIFKEAGFYKYRLKANNGEILIVSIGYKSKASVLSGIDTLKRNMPNATTRVVTDKNGYSQFRISNSNDSRLIAAGEIYASDKSAQSALASVMNFYKSEKIVTIDELPENEVREWDVELPPIAKATNGKIIMFQEDGKYLAKLNANNGETLFVTSTYSSRKALLNAIDNLKQRIGECRITIARDKQNRYQFRVFSDNGMLLLVGETYNSRDGAISSATSMRNFLPRAKIIEQ